jgi:anaerobic selenocysteine-containing dehydrogenase
MENPKPESQNNPSKSTRRDFLKLAGTATAIGAGALALKSVQLPAVSESASAAERQPETIVKTTCGMCSCGCGLDVRVVAGRAVKIEGNPLHPLNQGVCCLRAQASLEALYSPERLQHPMLRDGERGSGSWREIPWNEALQIVTDQLVELRQKGLPHSVAFLHGEARGQMRALIERFMQAYGSPNVISQDSLGEGAARLAMLVTQGINGFPIYDLNHANYVMAFGGNLLESNRHVIGYLAAAAFMRRGRPQRGKLVTAHPRLGLTGIKADEWVPIRPGTYAALALGMAYVMINSNLYDAEFVRDFTFGFEDFEDETGGQHQGFKSMVLEHYPLERVAAITGVATETIARLAGEFATNRPAVAIMPNEIGELSSGNSLYTAMAIHALNALVGSIDTQGGVWIQRFPTAADWPAYEPDETAKQGLAQARLDGAATAQLPLASSVYQNVAGRILADEPYPINLLFMYNANPVYELPNQGSFSQALMKVPLVVSFAATLDESAAHADLILPASTYLEIWGDDYLEGTGYAGVSLRRPVIEPVHDTCNPGDVLLEIAARLGGPLAQALPWSDYKDLVTDRLSGVGFDWDILEANGNWSELVYFNAAPGSTAWNEVVGRDRLNAPRDGRFDLYSRELFYILANQARVGQEQIDLACLPHFELPSTLADDASQSQVYPFLLVTQSLLTQTRNWQGIIPTLQESYGLQNSVKWDSWLEINPIAAHDLGIEDDDEVWVESAVERVKVKARVYPGIWPSAVFLPLGQGHFTSVEWGRFAQTGQIGVNPNQLAVTQTEPLTGQAIFNPTRVKVYKA